MELGVNISPIAFLIVKQDSVKLLTVDASRPLDKLIDIAPDIANKIMNFIDSKCNKKIDIPMD